jgi:CheY-like chemotaxis protein
MKEMLAASTGESLAAMPLRRLVIEGALARTDFLVLLSTLHPSFTGDVLLIDRADHAFLSAMADGGPRVLYTLAGRDIEFYVDVNELRQGAVASFKLVSAPMTESLAAQPMRVLIAEHDVRARKSLIAAASQLGCEVIVASSGFETLRLAEEHRADVLLLDGLIPEMHGFEVARFVKRIDSAYQPRVVMLTENEVKLQYGVDGYLAKPVTFDQIGSAIFGESPAAELAAAS